ncbi:DUF3575 domain-containing protein [bacterium]|nr:MAG: DUF3575 domain-containing protein [bacterium]
MKTISLTFLLAMLITNSIFSQELSTKSEKETQEFTQSISICPIAIAFGIYSMNYEYLAKNHHGFMIRADYESIFPEYSAANIDAHAKAVILNYRYHLKGGMKSMFIGAFSRFREFNGEGALNNQGFDFSIKEMTLGANAGKKWIMHNGFTFTFALGYGRMFDDLNAKGATQPELDSIHTFKKDYDLYTGFFGEVSIGYTF